MNRYPTLLAIFAHPDDESFGPGGMLARYAAAGTHVHVIIATDGIAGSLEAGRQLDERVTLAQVRAAELSDAAIALGITTIWSLPFRDSGMRGSPDNQHPQVLIQQPLASLIAEVRDYMLRLQPHVVVTHDPFGGYGHPDHIRCCEATTAAFHSLVHNAAGADGTTYCPQKLYYTAFDKRLLKVMARLMPLLRQDPTALGRNKDINLVEIARWETPIHTRIDVRDYLPQKQAASQAHASQYSGGPSFIRVFPSFMRRRLLGSEAFTRVYPTPTSTLSWRLNEPVETDFFAGLSSLSVCKP